MASYSVIFIGFIGAWLSFPDELSASQKIGLILLVSLLARIVMMGVPVSDDVYRYLWEGKVVAAGESPYQYPADHAHYVADAPGKKSSRLDLAKLNPPRRNQRRGAVGAHLFNARTAAVLFSVWNTVVNWLPT